MNVIKKISEILIGLAILFAAVSLILEPKDAAEVIGAIIGITLFVIGIRYLIFYSTMARHMVGGRMIFYTGLIILDLSLLSTVILQKSHRYILLYLVAVYAFYGVVQLLRSFEGKKHENPSWKFKFLFAVVDLVICVACIFFIRSESTMSVIYAIGLVPTGVSRIVEAFKREETVGIQL